MPRRVAVPSPWQQAQQIIPSDASVFAHGRPPPAGAAIRWGRRDRRTTFDPSTQTQLQSDRTGPDRGSSVSLTLGRLLPSPGPGSASSGRSGPASRPSHPSPARPCRSVEWTRPDPTHAGEPADKRRCSLRQKRCGARL